jgi:hypothetical protein
VTTVSGDEDLMVELRSLFTHLDPVDPRLLDQARFAYCWRSLDSELAELSFDSLVDHDLALAVRSGDDPALEPRMLGFGAVVDGEDVAIEVEVTPGAAGSPVLVGQLLPPEAALVELQAGTGEVGTVHADELGRFLIEPVPSGPVRLLVRRGERLVHTTWVSYVRA